MDFQYSSKTQDLRERVAAFMQEHIYPVEGQFYAEVEENTRRGARWTPTKLIEELKPKARAAGLWNLFLPDSSHGAGPDEPGVRAARRDHGPRALGLRGLQLLGAGHRQHGDDRALRHARAEGAVAQAAAGRRDPLRLRDDRARGRLVGRHQHPDLDPARRRLVRHQRPQVVDLRRRRSALHASTS